MRARARCTRHAATWCALWPVSDVFVSCVCSLCPQAYVNNQTLELQGGRNVLQSAALIEANNTRILVNVSRVPLNYTSLDVSGGTHR